MNLERAISFAAEAHRGQKDKAGVSYILHPLRVMLAFPTSDEEAQIVAVLHDVIEDTDATLDHLHGEGFSARVVEAVDALTRREGEQYMAFVLRAKANPIARRVKVADIMDNMGRITPDLAGLERRYTRALLALQDPQPETPQEPTPCP